MATINSILNKIHKTELETHETKLALIDDLKSVIAKVKSEEGESNKMKTEALKAKKMFDDATNLKNSLQNTYESNKVKYNKQLQENNALFKGISNQAKELGIAVTELPIYKEYVNASNILNELNKSNQTNWELISKY
jgi:cell fate (sporulation/competence/biofilm development) regulator YlbF (YheA/YmcA/DUF963 family)